MSVLFLCRPQLATLFFLLLFGFPFFSNAQSVAILPEMVAVEGGTFMMGCTEEQEEYCKGNEKPVREVTLSDYLIGKYPVTNEEYIAFLNEATNQMEGGRPWVDLQKSYLGRFSGKFEVLEEYLHFPVKGVTWYGARAYAEWLSVQTGRNFRLPTEAEWEFAARGGNLSEGYVYSGSNTYEEIAKEQQYYDGFKVGQYQANELGVHDMTGNIQQWCSDWYRKSYPAEAQVDPQGLENDEMELKVVRGLRRVTQRFARVPIQPLTVTGFRLAESPN